MANLSDHIVFVTGAGIGAATASRYLTEGARVVALDHRPDGNQFLSGPISGR